MNNMADLFNIGTYTQHIGSSSDSNQSYPLLNMLNIAVKGSQFIFQILMINKTVVVYRYPFNGMLRNQSPRQVIGRMFEQRIENNWFISGDTSFLQVLGCQIKGFCRI
jgi:hypothetical protein